MRGSFCNQEFPSFNPLRTLLTFTPQIFALTSLSKPIASLIVLSGDSWFMNNLYPMTTAPTHHSTTRCTSPLPPRNSLLRYLSFRIHYLGPRPNYLFTFFTFSSFSPATLSLHLQLIPVFPHPFLLLETRYIIPIHKSGKSTDSLISFRPNLS